MNRFTICMFALLSSASSATAQNPVLYEHPGSSGQRLTLYSSIPNLHAHGMGDRATSAWIPDGWTITLREHANFRGAQWTLYGPVYLHDLRWYGRAGGTWNDCVSSVELQFHGRFVPSPGLYPYSRRAGYKNGVFWQKDFYPLRNGMCSPLDAPFSYGKSLTFVDSISYLPESDDDFSFRIEPRSPWEPDRYLVEAQRGNSNSSAHFALNTWMVPDDVEWERKLISLDGNSSFQTAQFTVPPGYKAITVIELLSYWTGGDRDLSYAARAMAMENNVLVTAVSDFGREGASQVLLRATVLRWRSGNSDVHDLFQRLTATMSRGAVAFFDPDAPTLVTPTAYMADTSKYPYEWFDWLADATLRESHAGKNIDWMGTIDKVMSANTNNWYSIYQAVRAIANLLLDVFGPDQRDDDFYVSCYSGPGVVSLGIGHGNRYSLAEVTLQSPDLSR